MTATSESINNLTSDMVLGYFKSLKSTFYVKMSVISMFEYGDVKQHSLLSERSSILAKEFNDVAASQDLASIRPEVVENLKEDAVTSLLSSSWAIFEQVIKDIVSPDYATRPIVLNADYRRKSLGFTNADKDTIDLFYHIRNALLHYNGAYNAVRQVNVTYQGSLFASANRLGEKIIVSPSLAMNITCDLEKYAMSAWSHAGRL